MIETINIKTEKAKLLKARHIVNPQVSKASNRLSNQVTRSSCSASLDSADNKFSNRLGILALRAQLNHSETASGSLSVNTEILA